MTLETKSSPPPTHVETPRTSITGSGATGGPASTGSGASSGASSTGSGATSGPSISSSGAASGPSTDETQMRVAELRAEAELASDKTAKAALLYEAGFLSETALNQPAQAVNDYLAAFNLDNRFRLPLHALIRLFERKRSLKNLARLYDTELRAAHTAEEKATALIDQSVLAMIAGNEPEAVHVRLARALESDDGLEAALLLEWTRRAARDPNGAFDALLRRARGCDDPVQRGTLLVEVAGVLEQRGDISGALDALKNAAFQGIPQEAPLAALARFARTHGFIQELVEASEKRAELAASELRALATGNDADPALQDLLRSRAVAHWYEAARLRCANLGDPEGGLQCISHALEIRPDDLLLRQTRMLAFDLKEDRASAAEEARALLEQGLDGEHAAALHFRLAEHALVTGDLQSARDSLMEAIAHAGGSIAADAILDDLLLDDGLARERVERREARAATANPSRAARFLFEAALIAAADLNDPAKALALFRKAASKADAPAELAREAYGAALDLVDPELARFALDRLLANADPEEKPALLHHRLELTTTLEERRAFLDAQLKSDDVPTFILESARLHAAEQGDVAMLASAHVRLAERSLDPERAAAHWCAAARAHLRGEAPSEAKAILDRVLTRNPVHRYALALQEEVLKSLGEHGEIVGLLRRAAEAHAGGRDAESSLLLAGAAAEAAHDSARAAQSYEQAGDRNPESKAPIWALLRLGQRTSDAGLVLKAREGLAAREATEQRVGIESLLLAEQYELMGQPVLAVDNLDAATSDPLVGAQAAVVLSSMLEVTPDLREQALEVLVSRSADESKPPLFRELGGFLLAQGAEQVRVLDSVERLQPLRPQDPWGLWTRASLPLPHDEEGHASALETIGHMTSDPLLADAMRAEALFVAAVARPNDSLAPVLARMVGEDQDLTPQLSKTVLEMASPVRDSALRARALRGLVRHGGPASAVDHLALVRAHLAFGDATAAWETLEAFLAQHPDSLEGLELVRVVGRRAGKFAEVAQAAEKLAQHLDGELALQLLEEGAVVRMDELSDLRGAERLLREVLEREPTRKLAYQRLHDLLSARNDTQAVIALVRARLERIDEAEELVGLFYELARLCRATGDLDAALDALDNVLMLEEHVGALALAAEIHTTRENWEGAVEALRGLAEARYVPVAQRRLARLGAADFLEHRLKDGAAALHELDQIVAGGTADAALFTRIADVAARIGNRDRAIGALLSAIDLAEGETQHALRIRCAQLLASQGDNQRAAELLEHVVSDRPGHVTAVRALYGLTADEEARGNLLDRFEERVRAELLADPLDPESLRKLQAIGELAGSAHTSFVALSTLTALQAENLQEREAAERVARKVLGGRTSPVTPVTEADLSALCSPRISGAYANVMNTVLACAGEIDQLEPARFGVGRGQRLGARDPNGVRDSVVALASALGLKFEDFYVGGDDPGRTAALPREEQVSFVIGPGVTAPLSGTRRVQTALQLAAVRMHTLPLLSRTPVQAARLIFAAMLAAECSIPSFVAREELGDLPRALAKALPRKAKKALPELVRALPDQGAALEQNCQLALRHTRRLALLLSGDLHASLELILGSPPSYEAVSASHDALDLVACWTSSTMQSLRNKLGFAP